MVKMWHVTVDVKREGSWHTVPTFEYKTEFCHGAEYGNAKAEDVIEKAEAEAEDMGLIVDRVSELRIEKNR